MKAGSTGRWSAAFAAAGVWAGAAVAQTPPVASDSDVALEEVVVTGTLVRGVAPTGSAVATLGQADIEQLGATQTNQILTSIPQLSSSFNLVPNVPTAAQGRSTYRPSLRGLPALGNGTTLILVDGHNIVGASMQQSSPDIGALPVGAIERVEVVLDGGSATYGSDAVAGTLNFITRTHYQGVEVSGDYGGAGAHHRNGAINITAGHDWSGGGLVAAASWRNQTAMPNGDLPLPRQDLTPFGLSDFRVNNACSPGNVTAGAGATAKIYPLPSLSATAAPNVCDTLLKGVTTPNEYQTSGFVSISQAFGDNLDFVVKAYGADRVTRTPQQQLTSAARITNTNPYFIALANTAGVLQTAETVSFAWETVLGPQSFSQVKLDQFDVSPQLTWKLGHDWRVNFLGDLGWSKTTQDTAALNATALTAALAGTTAATAFNPYNPTATNATVLQGITNWGTHGWNVQRIATLRAVADGPLASLPGGDLRAAGGLQFQRKAVTGFSYTGVPGGTVGAVTDDLSRNVSSLFAEFVIPIVGDGNAKPGVKSLTLDLSGRYDNYQTVGSTTNPKIGLDWGIVDGVKIRGNYGTAFVAPGLQDLIRGGIDAQVQINIGSTQQPTQVRTGDAAAFANSPNVVLTGGQGAGIKPVKAKTWALGVDLTPTFLQGLTVSGTYWNIRMDDVIQSGCAGNFIDQLNNPALDNLCYFYRPSQALATSLTDPFQIIVGSNTIAGLYAANTPPYYIQDRRRRNFGGFTSTGVDFNVAFKRQFGWGTGSASLAGTHYISRYQQGYPGAPFQDVLATAFPPTSFAATLRAEHGPISGSLTANYISGYNITGAAPTTHLPSFMPINLFLRYQFPAQLGVTLNVNNVTDRPLAVSNFSAGGGIFSVNGLANANTLGRYYSVGVTKHF